jgi:dihydrofolate synthase/folylpolyglutamate synthase
VSSRDYLFSLEQIGIKLGLDQIRALLGELGRPDHAFPSLIIAGTNGKGSVTAMVERGLRAAGYRTGRYTSPHLLNIEERFAIDGQTISTAEFDALASRIQSASAALPSPPSFFEATTALALEAFRVARVDIAVLEVGLGGRLDATNAVDAVAVAITAIDYDHQAYLGDTIEAIAGEKAGVIKRNRLVVLGENSETVRGVIADVAIRQNARLVYAPDDVTTEVVMTGGLHIATIETPRETYRDVHLRLRGRHQIANAVVATRLLEELAATGQFSVPSAAIRTALEDVEWPGRLEWRQWQEHDVLIDGAHNPAGAHALADYVREVFPGRVPVVVGAMRDKHIAGMIAALAPIASAFICTAAHSPRAATPDEIAATCRLVATDIPVESVLSPMDAIALAAARGNPVVVAGSLYLAGEIRPKLS